MSTYILTSMYQDGFDKRTSEMLCSVIENRNRIVCIASDFNAPDMTDHFWNMFYSMFKDIGLDFEESFVVDARMSPITAQGIIRNADVIWLSGGDTPTEYKYLLEYGLVDILRQHDGVIIGMSAGTLNLAKTVLCPICNGHERQLIYDGLGCVDITVLSHYNKGEVPIEIKELSNKTEIYMMTDGSYILCSDDIKEYYGDIICVSNEKVRVISSFQINKLK